MTNLGLTRCTGSNVVDLEIHELRQLWICIAQLYTHAWPGNSIVHWPPPPPTVVQPLTDSCTNCVCTVYDLKTLHEVHGFRIAVHKFHEWIIQELCRDYACSWGTFANSSAICTCSWTGTVGNFREVSCELIALLNLFRKYRIKFAKFM